MLKTYQVAIDPLLDRNDWVISEHVYADLILPPMFKRLFGRPKKKSRDKLFSKLLSTKGKIHVLYVELQGMIGELVEIGLVLLSLNK